MQDLGLGRVGKGVHPNVTWPKNYPKCMGIIRVQLKVIRRQTFIKLFFQQHVSKILSDFLSAS